MSNLLERAIIDAKALKEAALKNAEQLVIEKYSQEVKSAMSEILESEDEITEAEEGDPMDDLFGDTPDAQVDPEPEIGEEEVTMTSDDIQSQIPDAFLSEDDEIIQIKLDSLDDEIEEDEITGPFASGDELGDDEIGIDITDDEALADVDIDTTPDMDTTPDADIGVDISPEMIAEVLSEMDLDGEEIDLEEVMEAVRVDFEPVKSGWAGTPEKIMQEYESMLLAREQDSEVKKENEELRKNVAALKTENKTLSSAAIKLQEQNKYFNTAFKTMQEKLETMNVSSAKLLYINQALENASLNERQKRKIVEAISKAGTVQEAKIMFETLNETVTTTTDVKKTATLSEVVSRRPSLLVAARKEQPNNDANPFYNRMKMLAGLKTQ